MLIPTTSKTGQTVKVSKYLNEDDVLQTLLNMKAEKEQKAAIAEVQQLAGNVGSVG